MTLTLNDTVEISTEGSMVFPFTIRTFLSPYNNNYIVTVYVDGIHTEEWYGPSRYVPAKQNEFRNRWNRIGTAMYDACIRKRFTSTPTESEVTSCSV